MKILASPHYLLYSHKKNSPLKFPSSSEETLKHCVHHSPSLFFGRLVVCKNICKVGRQQIAMSRGKCMFEPGTVQCMYDPYAKSSKVKAETYKA